MASLKELRGRINSVKSTQKITSAMKMVAAAKLRRAQERAEAARPYAERMGRMLTSLAAVYEDREDVPALLGGTGREETHLFIIVTSDRGLCGGFNSSIVREVKRRIRALVNDGKSVKILIIGRKGRDQLKRDHGDRILDTVENVGRPHPRFAEGAEIASRVARMFAEGEFDVCSVVYNKFKSAISQVVTESQLIPTPVGEEEGDEGEEHRPPAGPRPTYEYEPREEEMLPELLERNLAVQLYSALLESAASEHGARMSAMDNATRNASDMIESLTKNYNRTRQAAITTELIEIISGAEAL